MASNPFPGTTFDKTNNKWKARVTQGGKTRTVGIYRTQAEAYQAVQQAKSGNWPTPLFEPAPTVVTPDNTRKNTKVAQHNLLVETRLPLSLMEARLFVLMLRCIHREAKMAPAIVIPISDLVPKSLGGSGYESLREAVNHFLELRITLPVLDDKKDVKAINLVQAMELNSAEGVVVGVFSPLALPYLMALTDNFTVGQVDELMSLKSANTHRFYWLMRSWQFRSPITVTVAKLRELTTQEGSYGQYADFRNKVLQPSIDELNGLDFQITFSEQRKGRAVDTVRFDIGKQDAPKQLLPVEKPKQLQLTPLQEKVRTRLGKLKLTEAQIKKVLEVVVGEEQLTKLLKETYPVLRDYETKAKPGENVAAATMALLKSTFPAIWAAN
ncbi:MAG: RepB family plasmid replication initiator protein [Hymenobacter sp.]|nr:MAG: RepB family plasmid replication initiator protein [Hymenobacter sp.]